MKKALAVPILAFGIVASGVWCGFLTYEAGRLLWWLGN